jgi:penicillin-binding protein 2
MTELNKIMLQQRKWIFSGVVLLIFLFLLYGFFNIQIASAERYYQMSFENSVRQLTDYPARGVVRDKNGKILVDNRPSFLLTVIPRRLNSDIIKEIAGLLGEEEDYVREKIRGRNSFRPVILKRDLDYATVAKFEERRLDLPGVLVEVETKRFYPENVESPHIFGYVGEVTSSQTHDGTRFEPGELIGKSGLELIYDTSLRGVKGVEYVRVDAEGRELGIFSPELNMRAQQGMDLYLTLDYDLQQFAESLMVDNRGAIIALDPRDGSVLAFVSKPDFDPRLLSGRINSEVWSSLLNDPGHPLYSRVIQSTYPPGSTYKIVAAIAALQEGIITSEWKVTCPGYFKLGRRTIKCWNAKGHGTIDLLGAIKGSCNVYFYQLGLKIGLDLWTKYSEMFLFGQRTGIDLPNENSGLVPSQQYFERRYGKNGWTRGNLANLAIGQGELLTTPLQMAQFTMILANKGTVHSPHIADYLYEKRSGRQIFFPSEVRYVTGVTDEMYDWVREGMFEVVHGGTGWRAGIPGVEVAGKTGTAQNPHGDDHAWFIGFAPYDNPTIAIAVVIENGGSGGGNAAPIAGKVMEMYLFDRLLPRFVPRKDTLKVDEPILPFNLDLVPRLEINPMDARP